MTISSVKSFLEQQKDAALVNAYLLAPKILVNTYIMLGENFFAVDSDFETRNDITINEKPNVFPRQCSTIFISRQDFLAQVSSDFDAERNYFAAKGRAYFDERDLGLEFHQRVCSWVQPLSRSGYAALVPSVAREIVDRIFPQHNMQRYNELPIYEKRVQEAALQVGITSPLLTTLKYVWEEGRPMVCALQRGLYSQFETGMFHDFSEAQI